jgi:hypothetical protein
MESKLIQEAIAEYSRSFSEHILRQSYVHKERLNGQDVLSLTPLKQVNLFVVKEIFMRWKGEVERLKSPYFNYDATEVRSALADFMDVVSQHISIDEANLRPLLEKAATDTLYLLLAPIDYYQSLLNNPEKASWSVSELEDTTKYVRINRHLLQSLTEACRQEGSSTFSKDRMTEIFRRVLSQLQEPPEDTEPYLRQFQEVYPLDSDKLYVKSTPTTTAETSPSVENREVAPSPEAPSPLQELKKEEGLRTLNDYLNKAERSTLADQHQQRKIEKLSRHISVNQKFMFIKELFSNDAQAFNRAVEQLDEQNSYAEAIGLIRREFAQSYRWKMDSEEVVEFMELIAKRF